MADEKKIRFSGEAGGLISTFQKLKEETKQLNKELIQDALKYSSSSKEQVKFIEDQIKAIQRRNQLYKEGQKLDTQSPQSKIQGAAISQRQAPGGSLGKMSKEDRKDDIQIQLLKDIVETIKDTAKEEIAQDRKGVEKRIQEFKNLERKGKAGQISEEEQFKLKHQEELLGGGEGEGKKQPSAFTSMFAALTADRLLTSLGTSLDTVIHAQSSEDIVKPMASMIGAGAGGAAGALIDLLPLVEGIGPLMARMGEMLGDKIGEAHSRHIEEEHKRQIAENRLRARGGSTPGALVGLGMTSDEMSNMAFSLLQNMPGQTGGQLRGNTRTAAGLQQGFGVDQGTIQATLAANRVSTDQSLSETFGRMITVLDDKLGAVGRQFLEESVRNQNMLVNQFQSVRETVNREDITSLMFGLSGVGGSFSVTDPRQMQTIQGLQQGLTQPGNDFMQAANFSVLRQTLGPEASFLDILKAQEQGLGGDKGMDFLKNYVEMIANRGGSKDMQTIALKQRFGSLNFEQAEQLLQNRGEIKGMSDEELKSMIGEGGIVAEGAKLTSRREVEATQIGEAFAKGAMEGVSTVAELFSDKITELMSEGLEELKGQGEEMMTKMVDEVEDKVNKMVNQVSDKISNFIDDKIPDMFK